MSENITITIIENFPFMSIASVIIRQYKKRKDDKFYSQIQVLIRKNVHEQNTTLFEVLFRGFIVYIQKQLVKEQKISKLRRIGKSVLDLGTIDTHKVYHVGEYVRIQSIWVFDVSENLKNKFMEEMDRYFNKILEKPLVRSNLYNSNKSFSKEYNRTQNEIESLSKEELLRWLYPERIDLLSKLKTNFDFCTACNKLFSVKAKKCPRCGHPLKD